MVEPIAIISVHSQLPKDVIPNTELDLNPANWEWQECLSFPIDKFNSLRLSSSPYKWIRFVTGIIIGARGHLCVERDSLNPIPIDYDSAHLSTVDSINLYYHTTHEEKRRMFPIDPHLSNTRTMTSSRLSTRCGDFRDDVEGRDGSCVVTGCDAIACDAAHLLPHSKGDMYVETFSIHRRRDSSGNDDVIDDIDNVRNGLFVNKTIHSVLGKHIAFLRPDQTPNFAMDTTDVDPNADRAQERLTNHLFLSSLDGSAGHSGSAVRIPSNMSVWPPPSLLDAIYASAVLHHFRPTMDSMKTWAAVFYPGGPMNAPHADDKLQRNQADADKENIKVQKVARQQHYERCNGRHEIDSFDLLALLPFKAMGPEKMRKYMEASQKVAAEQKRNGRTDEDIYSWREFVDASNHQ